MTADDVAALASARALVASASFTASDHSPVKMT